MLCLINIFAYYGETVLYSICATSALSSRFSSYVVFKHWAIKWKRQDEEVFKSNEKCKENLCQYKIRFLQEKNKHNREKELIFQQMNKSSKHNNKIIAQRPLSLYDFQHRWFDKHHITAWHCRKLSLYLKFEVIRDLKKMYLHLQK